MNIATVLITGLLALAVTGSAVATLTRQPAIVATVEAVGFPTAHLRVLGALKLAAALGLGLGLLWLPISVAAAAGLVAYFLAAVYLHIRARDNAIVPPTVFLALSVAALVLLVLVAR
ncbi:DoxX family protein [Nocardia bovistercoris]|uniref:DoxX family protein n=1 Tax=Nocardia bovistercoris TaxID=2785916 RepID=A0A931IDK9_9NOCA|nr:DoxX family protein [Nocardia bovistercoris]MBH0778440.1 DoxX family protein [Nocardia bovistercoris]